MISTRIQDPVLAMGSIITMVSMTTMGSVTIMILVAVAAMDLAAVA